MTHLWFPDTQDTLSKGAKPGHWKGRSAHELGTAASKLSFDGITTRINSLPTPWSRVVQIEQAITNTDYPTRGQLLDELFGCLAVVALSDLYNLDLKAEILHLEELRNHREPAVCRFASSLWANKPEASQSVLGKPSGVMSDWDRLMIFMIKDAGTHQSQPIGFASPSSVLCPTAQLRWPIAGVPWIDKDRFSDPTPHLSLQQHKQPLANWLKQLVEDILSIESKANTPLADNLCTVLKEFIDRLVGVQASTGPDKGEPIPSANRSIMGGLLVYSAAPVKLDKNLCRVMLTDKREGNLKPVILVDPSMPRQLQKKESEIQLYGPDTLATISGDAERLRQRYKDITVVTPDDLFLDNLTLLPGGNALEHSWLPEKLTARLEMGNWEDTTPLLPFSAGVQKLFSSSELKERVSLAVDHSLGCLVVELRLTLEGFDEDHLEYHLERSYPLKEAKLLGSVPVIAIWPAIPAGRWHKYWIFSQMVDGLSVDGTEAWEGPERVESGSDSVHYFCSEHFPDLLKVSVDQRPGGLIPLESPEPTKDTADLWDVGLDFGTSFTNWAIYDHNHAPRRFPLQSALWPVTAANAEVQEELLNRYFLPQTMYPEGDNPPTSTSLSVMGGGNKVNSDREKPPELFHEARLHIPQPGEAFKSHLRTGFKWEHPELQRPFLKQLALMISADAVRRGAEEMTWRLSYPTAFSNNTRTLYRDFWQELTEELGNITGLKQRLNKRLNDGPLLSEAVAFARCLAERQTITFQHTACMDIGGRTTDISLWQRSSLVHQVSVPFAGQHICTKILNCRPEFAANLLNENLNSITEGSNSRTMELNRLNLIDNYIRFGSENLLGKLKMQRSRTQSSKDKTLEQFISLMALATGGLYHYLGFIVRCLYEKNTLNRRACVSVCVGGNGGKLLHWLAPTGKFAQDSKINTWLNRIQASAIDWKDDESNDNESNDDESAEGTRLSGEFKDEVAIGLVVVGERHISAPDDLSSNPPPPFSGESLCINGHEFTAEQPIDLSSIDHDEPVKTMELLDLKELQRYVRGTVKAMEGLRADLQIDPLVKESDLESANSRLRTRVLERAQNLCDQSLGDPQHPRRIDEFSVEPGFFLGLRALIEVLAEDWAADKL
ncbi:MAG: hypothetical protein TE42_01720 [Candidatus Synechococcus spongiarum SP3]|uniref:Uncharacterized protein n=1 Tax=Candidatus Synechococcus spongiarum SP3 TaxID=1604020 RepID=A0A0G2HNH6_9SYNE|nr:MAG: hypothetical protein TE42_01720 [Candidatus Synechococcus spongiarum SP3]